MIEMIGGERVETRGVTMPERPWRRVRLVIIQPPGYPHTAAFHDLIESLFHAFAALGAAIDVTENAFLTGEGVNIVFGAHLIPFTPGAPAPPKNSVIFNLEQLGAGSIPEKGAYIDVLKAYAIFDYSRRNIDIIGALADNRGVRRLRLGYMPQMTRIPRLAAKDVDVLFYGSVNARRGAVLDGIAKTGLRLQTLFGVYGAARDEWIARSKIVITIHAYDDKVHELVRSSYLLANRAVALCECDGETEIEDDIRAAIVGRPYERLVEACHDLIRMGPDLDGVGEAGFRTFIRRDQVAYLRAAIAMDPPARRISE